MSWDGEYYDYDSFPSCETLSNRTQTARKEHILDCKCVVKPGEKYRVTVIIIDGEFQWYKSHLFSYCEKNMRVKEK